MERILATAGLAVVLIAVYAMGLSADLSAGGIVAMTLWTGVIVAIGVGLWKKEG